MVPERFRRLDQRGWSLAELLVVIAVIGILSAISIPFFVSYLRASTVRAGAQQLRTSLNLAKQLSITGRQNICVQALGDGYQFRQNNCGGAALLMAGTDGVGTFRLQNNVAVVNNGPPTIFTPLGAAAPGGTFTVTAPSGDVLTVTVSAAGRITTP